jgi:hypothetical protein
MSETAWFTTATSAINQALAFMGEEFEYRGQTFKGVINESNTSEILALGGFEQHASIDVVVSKTGFPDPVKGEYVTIKGVRRRIFKTTDHPVSWTLSLEHIER